MNPPHIYVTKPTGPLVYALTEGVRLNNEGSDLAQAGRFEEAIPLLVRALDIKEKAHGMYSTNFCVSLSTYADCLLGIGDFENAYKKARLFLDIALAIGSPEQTRIAREILKDISVKAGTELLPDEIQDFGPNPHSSFTGFNPKDNHIWTEPPVIRCHYYACGKVNNLKQCARCKVVFYCGKGCQKVRSGCVNPFCACKCGARVYDRNCHQCCACVLYSQADWKDHKKSCHPVNT